MLTAMHTASAAEGEPISPYRPSVSNSAQLPAVGQLELELGMLTASSDSRRQSLPYLMKLAWSEQWGVLLGGEARVRNTQAGVVEQGVGDTSLVLKRAFILDQETAYGLELSVKLPTAGSVLGSGKRDIGLNSIYSKDIGEWHVDHNLNLTQLGTCEEGSSCWQSGLSSAWTYNLSDKAEIIGEWSGTQRRGTKPQSQILLAFTYSPTPRLCFDIGVTKGMSQNANNWTWFAGVVMPLGKLF
ncbi:transporter family protein [Undibacterium rugosum]|nr:transporter [Undibacterium rugosum]